MKKVHNLCTLAVVLATILIVSCDAEGAKPWAGQELRKMGEGSQSTPGSIIRYSDAGKIYWFYIDAKEDMTYEIGFNLPISYWGMIGRPTYASCIMNIYKEDETIIVADKRAIGSPIYYYSPNNQRLYISFTFLTAGFISCYYSESEDHNEYEDDNEYYR
jgi:hypothetical protein